MKSILQEENKIILQEKNSIYILYTMFIVMGMFMIVLEAKFYIYMINGNYEEVTATVVDYEKSISTGKKHTVTYRKVYEYKKAGEVKHYVSSIGSNVGLGSIGDKEILYCDMKRDKVLEKPSKVIIITGIIFSGVGIVGMFITHRKIKQLMYNND